MNRQDAKTPRPVRCLGVVGVLAVKSIAFSAIPLLAMTLLAAHADDVNDLSLKDAVALDKARAMPTPVQEFGALKTELASQKQQAEEARKKSETLNAQTRSLKTRLADAAARLEVLEDDKTTLGLKIADLERNVRNSDTEFASDRVRVGRLLAVMERLQQDMPPAIVMKPDDAVAATRGMMLLGASLPRLYGEAAALSRRIAFLENQRRALAERLAEGAENERALADQRAELDQLLAMKSQEADEATARYGDLAAQLDAAARQTQSLGALLDRVAQLRRDHPATGIFEVSPQGAAHVPPDSSRLLPPVTGQALREAGGAAHGSVGLTFASPPGARVSSPADCQVLFAGPYHKAGEVLILQTAGGYDVVLAGLARVDVQSGDALLAGEPLGNMPGEGAVTRLYVELRHNGTLIDPAKLFGLDTGKARKS